ncbi:hypothetical protein [Mycolicibacterium fluoranthenivorans]|uniref:Uncharacterized protein n=1 Tax=Mycolicibacterium fluoranthenivorans TaxID=258505 RepID=A0A1G4WRT5_9MYCO|nr:hypothetical protein [Mycolicibacterium fluoranthenivorans]SCX27697.1 hypothetical protein SAMN02799620_04388 [Mycolicibacterium fluoranthenivorans]
MGAQSADSDDLLPPAVARLGADRTAVYRLDVIGVDTADVVRSAGGWLFDRAMAGWDVQVTLTRSGDLRPLQILGLRTGDRRDESVAVAAAGELGGRVQAALRRGRTEVTVWNAGRLTALVPVRHVLSAAACAFKAQALAAAGLDPAGVHPAEVFHGGNRSLLVVPSDLTAI